MSPPCNAKQVQLVHALEQRGLTLKQAAGEVGYTKERAYQLARRWNLPYNHDVKPGGPKERKILAARQAGYSREEVGRLYSLAVVRIAEVEVGAAERRRASL